MTAMELGLPVASPRRLRLDELFVFARWRSEADLEAFLGSEPLGRRLAEAWHVRLEFLRRWGSISPLDDLPSEAEGTPPSGPVAVVTLARPRPTQLPRFIRSGTAAERLVRDHPGQTLALAGMRPPGLLSTFSVWRSVEAMTAMVHGRSDVPDPRRHVEAMAERDRCDFHREFATLRFGITSEHGAWKGRSGIVSS